MTASSQPVAKSSIIMGIGATVAICTVLFTLGKLYGGKVDDIGHDVQAIEARELEDARRLGGIEARLKALEAQ